MTRPTGAVATHPPHNAEVPYRGVDFREVQEQQAVRHGLAGDYVPPALGRRHGQRPSTIRPGWNNTLPERTCQAVLSRLRRSDNPHFPCTRPESRARRRTARPAPAQAGLPTGLPGIVRAVATWLPTRPAPRARPLQPGLTHRGSPRASHTKVRQFAERTSKTGDSGSARGLALPLLPQRDQPPRSFRRGLRSGGLIMVSTTTCGLQVAPGLVERNDVRAARGVSTQSGDVASHGAEGVMPQPPR